MFRQARSLRRYSQWRAGFHQRGRPLHGWYQSQSDSYGNTYSILLIVNGFIALGVFLQLLQVDPGLEASLCFEAGREQGGSIHVPFADAFEILRAPLVIEDERRDLMAQALFEHEQPADASIAIREGADAFKAHMEVQNLCQLHFIEALVFGDQSAHLGSNVLWRRGFRLANGTGIPAILARMKLEFTLRHGAVAEHGVELADIGLGDAVGSGIDDVADTVEVVIRLDEIVHLDGLKANGHLAFLVDFLYLCEHQTVAGQAVGAVAEVDLYVIVETVVDLLGALALQFFDQNWKLRRFLLLAQRFLCIFWNQPSVIFENCSFNSSVDTISADHSL